MKINPMDFQVSSQKFRSRARGEKWYRSFFTTAGYSRMSRRRFQTAGQAIIFGNEVLSRLRQLYRAEAGAQPTPV